MDKRMSESEDEYQEIFVKKRCFNKYCHKLARYYCKNCKVALYCSQKCQLEDWIRGHNIECRKHILRERGVITEDMDLSIIFSDTPSQQTQHSADVAEYLRSNSQVDPSINDSNSMDGMTDLSDSQETNSSSSSSDESDYSISFTEGTAITSQKRNLDDEEKKNDKPIENSESIAIESLLNSAPEKTDEEVPEKKLKTEESKIEPLLPASPAVNPQIKDTTVSLFQPYCFVTLKSFCIKLLELILQEYPRFRTLHQYITDIEETQSLSTFKIVINNAIRMVNRKQSIDIPKLKVATPYNIKTSLAEFFEALEETVMAKKIQKAIIYDSRTLWPKEGKEARFCTRCGTTKMLTEHPVLSHVFLCTTCLVFYNSDGWIQSNGKDNFCRCCGDGGSVKQCDFCSHAICERCIMLHYGDKEFEKLNSRKSWRCVFCRQMGNKFIYLQPNGLKNLESTKSIEVTDSSATSVPSTPLASTQQSTAANQEDHETDKSA